MSGKPGWFLIAIGVLHLLLGLALAADLRALVASGKIWNAVEMERSPRVTLEFWFTAMAFPLILLGHVYIWAERISKRPLPAFLGWELLSFAVIGVVLDPDSGFWLILGVALYMLLRAYRFTRQMPKMPSTESVA